MKSRFWKDVKCLRKLSKQVYLFVMDRQHFWTTFSLWTSVALIWLTSGIIERYLVETIRAYLLNNNSWVGTGWNVYCCFSLCRKWWPTSFSTGTTLTYYWKIYITITIDFIPNESRHRMCSEFLIVLQKRENSKKNFVL